MERRYDFRCRRKPKYSEKTCAGKYGLRTKFTYDSSGPTGNRTRASLVKGTGTTTPLLFLSRLNLVQKETMWSLIVYVVCSVYVVWSMYVYVCAILQNWSLYPHTLMYSHGTWTQGSLGSVTHVTSTDLGSKVIWGSMTFGSSFWKKVTVSTYFDIFSWNLDKMILRQSHTCDLNRSGIKGHLGVIDLFVKF